MAKATRVYITPPTNTSAIDHPMMFPPRDPTRRRFLTVAAGASVVGAGSLAAAAMAPNVPAAVTVPLATATAEPTAALPDPVFGLIEAHRKADRDFDAALDEQNRLELIGDEAAADLVGEAPCHAAFNAFDVLLAAPAATLPGIVAKLAYLQDIAKCDAWMFNDRHGSAILLIESFAASIANVSVVQS
jgi:hypothetical protein